LQRLATQIAAGTGARCISAGIHRGAARLATFLVRRQGLADPIIGPSRRGFPWKLLLGVYAWSK
jgi:hypothetical protein